MASTQKTGFIGSDAEKNRFTGPKKERYFLQINPKTGETEVWNEEFGQDRKVGTYNKAGDTFTPDTSNRWLGKGARDWETDHFNTKKAQQNVRDQKVTVIKNENGRINQTGKSLTTQEKDDVVGGNYQGFKKEEQLTQKQAANARKAANEFRTGGGEAIARKRYGNYVYPITLRRSQQDRLRISVMKFQPRAFREGGLGGFGSRNEARMQGGNMSPIGSVTLPVPGQVSDSNKTDWGKDNMNAGQIAVANLALTGLTEGLEEMGNTGQGMAESVAKNKKEIKDAVAQFFVGQATQVKGIMARTKGAVINPNMELIFNAPQLRPFSFQYRLSPRDEKESGEILKIIRMFKQSMAPQTTASNIFLKAPNTYKLEFLTAGQNNRHKFLPRIKECALTGFDVTYTPDGSYMTYENSSMVAYQVTFSFQELEPVYNNDYGNLQGSERGDLDGVHGGVGF